MSSCSWHALACDSLHQNRRAPQSTPPPSPSFNVPCVVLSEHSITTDNGRVDKIGSVWGMLTADRLKRRRGGGHSSGGADVVVQSEAIDLVEGPNAGEETRREAVAEVETMDEGDGWVLKAQGVVGEVAIIYHG